jgi:hypothetical protein
MKGSTIDDFGRLSVASSLSARGGNCLFLTGCAPIKLGLHACREVMKEVSDGNHSSYHD